MTPDNTALKHLLAKTALSELLKYNQPIHLGLGTGQTINTLIPYLAESAREIIKTITPSSLKTQKLLEHYDFQIISDYPTESIDLYIDSADQFTPEKYLTKGGGGALTREKILASLSNTFWCLVEFNKFVPKLGSFPIPIEILPFARNYVVLEIQKLGGRPVLRNNFKTDQNNYILDIHDWNLSDPTVLEHRLKLISGVLDSGLFAQIINQPNLIFLAQANQTVEKIL